MNEWSKKKMNEKTNKNSWIIKWMKENEEKFTWSVSEEVI